MWMGDKPESGTKPDKRHVDLSLPQVAGSAAAAVTAAVLASFLGVYGTVIGAAVVSVVATTGGALYQHLFRRTGEQLREVSVLTKASPKPRGRTARTPGAPDHSEYPEYNESTVHGTRWRGWRRSLLAAGTVFALAMVVITGVELVTGPISGWFHQGGQGGTSVSELFGGGHHPVDPLPSTGTTPDTGTSAGPGRTPGTAGGATGQTPTPANTPSPDQGSPTPTPSQTPSATPTPTASGGIGGQGSPSADPGSGR
jgi:hypothetical protein